MQINRIGSVVITQDTVEITGFDVTLDPDDGVSEGDWLLFFSLIVREWAAARILESMSDFPAHTRIQTAADKARWN